MTDIYLTVKIQHNRVVYFLFEFSLKRGEYSVNPDLISDIEMT
jgi:hypothetical protein